MKKAFTLIEMLVVIGIIGILMGILIPALSGSGDSAKAAKCLMNMHNLAMAIQSYAQTGDGRYPMAGSIQKYTSPKKTATVALHGWIGWSTDSASGSYISPYSSDEMARYLSLTNGAVWKAVSKNREAYVCPIHRELTRKNMGRKDKYGPLWSYVMNADFGWAYESSPLPSATKGPLYHMVHNKARTLLFAELPFADCRGFQTPEYGEGAKKSNDPILQFSECKGGGDEIIGFNHKSGKRDWFAHVCYVDGHTEKFRLPKNPDNGNLKNLTKWLCRPSEEKHVFDLAIEGDEYIQLKN